MNEVEAIVRAQDRDRWLSTFFLSSRSAVEMIRLTKFTTVGSLAITSMSWRFLPSAAAAAVTGVLSREVVVLAEVRGHHGRYRILLHRALRLRERLVDDPFGAQPEHAGDRGLVHRRAVVERPLQPAGRQRRT